MDKTGGTYQFRVKERLEPDRASWFEGMSLLGDAGGTLIVSTVPDQAALHGVLGWIRDLGLTLLSVERIS